MCQLVTGFEFESGWPCKVVDAKMALLAALESRLEDVFIYFSEGHTLFEERALACMPSDRARESLSAGVELLRQRHKSRIDAALQAFHNYAETTCLPPVSCAQTLPSPDLGQSAITSWDDDKADREIQQLRSKLKELKHQEDKLKQSKHMNEERLRALGEQSAVWDEVLPRELQDPAVLDEKLPALLSEVTNLRALLQDAEPFLRLAKKSADAAWNSADCDSLFGARTGLSQPYSALPTDAEVHALHIPFTALPAAEQASQSEMYAYDP